MSEKRHTKYINKRLPISLTIKGAGRSSFDADNPILEWCTETWGPGMLALHTAKGRNRSWVGYKRNPDAKWALYCGRFYFREPQQAVLFKLRWV